MIFSEKQIFELPEKIQVANTLAYFVGASETKKNNVFDQWCTLIDHVKTVFTDID